MKAQPARILLALCCLAAPVASGHLIGDPAHDGLSVQYAHNVTPPTNIILSLAETGGNTGTNRAALIAKSFAPFAPKVKTRWDEMFFYVESYGMASHPMMTGITAWQQQVPMPQNYTGDNAWRFPLNPIPAAQPQTIRNHFLRGAIAIAVNGVPIFNPQNNRGEISAEIGELDKYGGHAGRADDYHYHAAPLHLQELVGHRNPIAFALDGYPIYGLTEPDNSVPQNLDVFDGHTTAALGYHYHASTKYPYINGGFHGEVIEREGQVDPQPRAQPVRPATGPLRGAVITGFQDDADGKGYTLNYTVNGQSAKLHYGAESGAVKFEFTDSAGNTTTKNYPTHFREAPRENPPQDLPNKRPARREQSHLLAPLGFTPKHTGKFFVTSSVVTNGGALPVEFTGDGTGVSPPLTWSGAPAETKNFAVVMDHLAPGNEIKCYWNIWDIPADASGLPKNSHDVGKLGPGFRGQLGYEPPHSQGPGLKTYVIHVFALSASPQISLPPRQVTRDVLLNAIKDLVVDSADLKVTYTKPETSN